MKIIQCLIAATLTLPALVLASDREMTFDVFLGDKGIGSHSYRFTSVEQGVELVSEAEYQVKILMFTAYRYDHHSREIWRSGCLRSIHARTDDDGSQYRVEGDSSDEAFAIRVSDNGGAVDKSGRSIDRDCVRTFAYWDPALLDVDALLNSQTGELEQVSLTETNNLALPWNGERAATAYRLATPGADIELWYDGDGDWLGLRSELENGRVLSYRLRQATGPSALLPGRGEQ